MTKKVYIADEDPGLIELIINFLEGIGYEADGSVDLLDLLCLDSPDLPDVFLLNSEIWGGESEMISSYLKSNEPTSTIPLILFSTLKRGERRTFDRYADGFISLPFEINELRRLLEKFAS
ncbi:hypothetical protein [Mucilaginibacter sp. FT3.2]|uniref:hypothetical protein n=1 Tax=Mucilaginibacter sp. FT3.2 TaxID=2723090 RepID=UPI001615151C|nr:hypothetical protein [Mucilaginibacter sp. FT3.2]MBB6229754.1 two-component system alkaline phosphatase synthesis response regulator PhoP [Mucilaginibacter sp. FT3.2]